MEYCMIITTCKDEIEANTIINTLLEKKLISCAQKTNIESKYVWKGEIVDSKEIVVNMKSETKWYPNIEKCILQNHSYEVPEIAMFEIKQGYTKYLNWIQEVTK